MSNEMLMNLMIFIDLLYTIKIFFVTYLTNNYSI